MLPNLRLALICGASVLASVYGAYWYGKLEGSTTCKASHAVAQLKHDKKVGENNAEIDAGTPFNADKPTSINWLLQFGGRK